MDGSEILGMEEGLPAFGDRFLFNVYDGVAPEKIRDHIALPAWHVPVHGSIVVGAESYACFR